MRPVTLVIGLLAASLGGACGREDGRALETEPVPLLVRVHGHRRGPLGGARINVDGAPAGVTDATGLCESALSGPDGRRVEVGLCCPDGLVPAGDAAREITLRRLSPVVAGDRRLAPIETVFACAPAEREHLLVVRTDGRAGLPVLVDGEVAAQTGLAGTAHVVIREAPGEEIEVVLDTSGRDELRPRSPSRRVRLPGEPRIVLFDQVFDERRQRAAPQRRGVSLPRRL
jgi:hypothetical protein